MKAHYITFKYPKRPKGIGQWFSWLTSVLTGGDCHMGVMATKNIMIHADYVVKRENINIVINRAGYSGYSLWVCKSEDYDHKKAVSYAESKLGTPYDFIKLFSVIRSIIYGWLGKPAPKKYDAKGLPMCQELSQESAREGNCVSDKDWRFPYDFQYSGLFTKIKDVTV